MLDNVDYKYSVLVLNFISGLACCVN